MPTICRSRCRRAMGIIDFSPSIINQILSGKKEPEMKNLIRKTGLLGITLSISFALSAPASADVACQMNITSTVIGADGWFLSLLDSTASGPKQYAVCSFIGNISVNDGFAARTITPDQCKAIYSQFLTAKAAARPVILNFKNPTDCSAASLPPNGLPPSGAYPYYFSLP